MASSKLHEHGKSSLNPEEFMHKKFRHGAHKRKRDGLENIAPTQIKTPLEQATKENKPKKPTAKRGKTDKPKTIKSKTYIPLQVLPTTSNNVMTSPNHSNMIQHPSNQHMEMEQHQPNRNTVLSMQRQCKLKAEQLQFQQQYAAYEKKRAVTNKKSLAMGLCLTNLQKVCLQRKNKLFLANRRKNL